MSAYSQQSGASPHFAYTRPVQETHARVLVNELESEARVETYKVQSRRVGSAGVGEDRTLIYCGKHSGPLFQGPSNVEALVRDHHRIGASADGRQEETRVSTLSPPAILVIMTSIVQRADGRESD